MGFKRFVEIGRVAVISYGPDSGKLCTIVDVIDHNRVLVDGPAAITGVHRHELGINRIMLTDLKVAAKHNASHKCAPAQHSPRAAARPGARPEAAAAAPEQPPCRATTAAAPPFRPRPAAAAHLLSSPSRPQAAGGPVEVGGRPGQVGRDELGEKDPEAQAAREHDRLRPLPGDAGAQGAERCAQGRVIAVMRS